ncbi:hypothetical protein AB4144_49395, partial [Rhizobiaceae sp. 2RAB30]
MSIVVAHAKKLQNITKSLAFQPLSSQDGIVERDGQRRVWSLVGLKFFWAQMFYPHERIQPAPMDL